MIVSKYFVEFVVYSFLGWIYECTFCSIKSKHWENRGFLYGPVCPIYGVGAIACSILFGNATLTINGELPIWEIFFICMIGSAFLEYGTSYFLEKRFHALWWDYSNIPFNVHGRICLPISICFGVAGVLITKYVIPVADAVKGNMHPIFSEVLALIFMAIMAADTALTVESLMDLTSKLDSFEEDFNTAVEEKYQAISEMSGSFKDMVLNSSFMDKLTDRQKYSISSMKRYTKRKLKALNWSSDKSDESKKNRQS